MRDAAFHELQWSQQHRDRRSNHNYGFDKRNWKRQDYVLPGGSELFLLRRCRVLGKVPSGLERDIHGHGFSRIQVLGLGWGVLWDIGDLQPHDKWQFGPLRWI